MESPRDARPRSEGAATEDFASGGVLATIAATVGPMPRVLLRDTLPGEEPGPIVRPGVEPGAAIRFRIDGEIARGGMGAVLKGRDPDLGRDVALKVLRDDFRDNADMTRRFVEEAQIGGQLQHPGIVPIYELGVFPDRRPFFAMKLVKGRTLAELLAERKGEPGASALGGSPAEAVTTGGSHPRLALDLPRFLSIFHSICQTVAYAHARGVIHRDLKPSNVMVGGFGEVQVMDWGLAKVLPRGGLADDANAGKTAQQETVIATARSGDDSDQSRAGSVLGTPSYMAPEQARGEVDRVDERADVFGLGSILCEILTGAPAFTGRNAGEIQRKAALGDLADAFNRLSVRAASALPASDLESQISDLESPAPDPDLLALARDCLAREPEDRPRDASAVADRLGSYLASIERRLRAAELDRAAETARAEEAQVRFAVERSRRRRTVALAASLLAMITLGGATGAYLFQQRQARVALADRILGGASTLLAQARAQPDDLGRWQAAIASVHQIDMAGLPTAARARLADLTHEIDSGAAAAQADQELLAKLIDIRSAEADDPDGSATDAAYADAFGAAGYDVDTLGPEAAGAKIHSRPEPVALALAAALDDWASRRREASPIEAVAWRRLVDAARRADPDPRRGELRALREQADRSAQLEPLRALAALADVATWPAQTLVLLAVALNEAGDLDAAVVLLRRAADLHAGDVWVNHILAKFFEAAQPPRRDEAIRYYTAARALRPETAHELAHALQHHGEADEAIAVFQNLDRLRPGNGRHLGCLGRALQEQGRNEEARAVLDAAAVACREAIRLKPDYVAAYLNLGTALKARGDVVGAISAFREAIRHRPDLVDAHLNLGYALNAQGDAVGAATAYREAIRLKPDYVAAYFDLGYALRTQGDAVGAIAAYREAARLRPDFADAHLNLGYALNAQGDAAGAATACREAIRLRPDSADAHLNLGYALNAQGDAAGATTAYREAIRLQPDSADAHCYLGHVLRSQGKYAEALAELRIGHELGSKRLDWHYPSARWVRDAERLTALADHVPALLSGDDQPKDNADRLALAQVCLDTKRYAVASRLWAETLAADPKLADDRQAQHGYNAACYAALATAGKGQDEPPPDNAAKAELRRQALAWLQAELEAWTQLALTAGPGNKETVAQTLAHWKQDADLATIRDEAELGRLPEAEQAEWRALWAEVDRLHKQAGGP